MYEAEFTIIGAEVVGLAVGAQAANDDRNEHDKGLPGFINLIGIESPGLTSCPAILKLTDTVYT